MTTGNAEAKPVGSIAEREKIRLKLLFMPYLTREAAGNKANKP